MNTLALVDGDSVLFRAGLASNHTEYNILIDGAIVYTTRYKKELKAYLQSAGLTEEDVAITKTEVIEPLENSLHTVKYMLGDIKERTKANSLLIYLGGEGNFREEVATSQPYKGNRWSREKRAAMRAAGKWIEWLDATEDKPREEPRRPHWEAQIKQYMIDVWGAKVVNGMETDDALGIMQMHYAKSSTTTTIIVTNDKDLRMIPGKHFNYTKEDAIIETIDDITAMRNFYKQILKGDTIDNIPGIRGVGEVTAHTILQDCTTEEQMYHKVREEYLQLYPLVELDKEILERARLLWILREKRMWNPPGDRK